MTTKPVQVTVRNMSMSPALEQKIHDRVAWLESFHPAIVGCRVLLDMPHRHRKQGRPVQVRIELFLPGEDVVVTHGPASDAVVAIHDAFDVARRRLEDSARRQRGDVKTHAVR